MIIPSAEQVYERWDTLTDRLREAISSEANENFIQSLFDAKDVYNENADAALGIIGYVYLGFLHPEDLAEELVAQVGIDQTAAKEIQDACNTKLFTPIRADIDLTYHPVIENKAPQNTTTPAILVQDVGAPVPQKGWSSARPPVMTQEKVPLSKPIPVPIPAKPATPPAAAPVMLQREVSFAAPKMNADFHIAHSNKEAQMDLGGAKRETKVMPAVIEFSKEATPQKPPAAPVRQQRQAPSEEFRASLASMPLAGSGDRHVTEITQSSPMAPGAVPIIPSAGVAMPATKGSQGDLPPAPMPAPIPATPPPAPAPMPTPTSASAPMPASMPSPTPMPFSSSQETTPKPSDAALNKPPQKVIVKNFSQ